MAIVSSNDAGDVHWLCKYINHGRIMYSHSKLQNSTHVSESLFSYRDKRYSMHNIDQCGGLQITGPSSPSLILLGH